MAHTIIRNEFLVNIKIGDRIRPPGEMLPWLVTGRMEGEISGGPIICLIGQADDVNPRAFQGYGWVVVAVFESVPSVL